MKDTPILGKLIVGDAYRDAVHIAIAPVIAGEKLLPNQDIGLSSDGKAVLNAEHIGKVDPLLDLPVKQGQKFYMWLYPNTITSLRHNWDHPLFPKESSNCLNADKNESKVWITEFAVELHQSYDDLMEGARQYFEFGYYAYDNSESFKDVNYDKWAEFWGHWEVVTGSKVRDEDNKDCFYTCSC